MDSLDVQILLEKHYGLSRKTLIIGESNGKSRREYNYRLPDEIVTDVQKITTALNTCIKSDKSNLSFIELTQLFEKAEDVRSTRCQCACYSEKGGKWKVEFYNIKGIRYHKIRIRINKSYSDKIVASIILDKHPVFSLDECDTEFYGFWRKSKSQLSNGMSYWASKNMLQDRTFLEFVADFINCASYQDNIPILRNVAMTIDKYEFFLPSVPFSELRMFKTPKQFIKSFMPEADLLGIDLNRLDLNVAYGIGLLSGVVERNDWEYLKTFSSDAIYNAVNPNASLVSLFEGIKIENLYTGFFLSNCVPSYYNCVMGRDYAYDYAKMCLSEKVPIKLGLSAKEILNSHIDLFCKTVSSESSNVSFNYQEDPYVCYDFEYIADMSDNNNFERLKDDDELPF